MSARRSVNGTASRHDNPIPNACRIGNLVMSSIISGRDHASKTLPDAIERQIANVFAYIKQDVEAAGATLDDVAKIDFWLKDPVAQRPLLNDQWVAFFPDPQSRPARQTHTLPADHGNKIQASFVAYVL